MAPFPPGTADRLEMDRHKEMGYEDEDYRGKYMCNAEIVEDSFFGGVIGVKIHRLSIQKALIFVPKHSLFLFSKLLIPNKQTKTIDKDAGAGPGPLKDSPLTTTATVLVVEV